MYLHYLHDGYKISQRYLISNYKGPALQKLVLEGFQGRVEVLHGSIHLLLRHRGSSGCRQDPLELGNISLTVDNACIKESKKQLKESLHNHSLLSTHKHNKWTVSMFNKATLTLNQKTFDPWVLMFVCCQERNSSTCARFCRSAGYQWSGVRYFLDKYCSIAILYRKYTVLLSLTNSKYVSNVNQGNNIPLC